MLSPVEIEPDEAALRGLKEQFSRADAVFWVSPTAIETAAPYVDFSDDLKVQIVVGQASGCALERYKQFWLLGQVPLQLDRQQNSIMPGLRLAYP